jgi:hypothetical protein
MVNRFGGACAVCSGRVPAKGGTLVRSGGVYRPVHLACAAGEPRVVTVRFGDGATYTRNSRGRCEDAPCCGCCTI